MATGPGGKALVIVEMKLGFTLDLVLQGADRAAAADQVWLAVRATRRGRDRNRRTWALCRLLGFGLLAIHSARAEAEVLVEAGAGWSRSNPRRRRIVLAEHAARRGDPSPGGVQGVPIMTAYRQDALACCAALQSGAKRPRATWPPSRRGHVPSWPATSMAGSNARRAESML